jgi:hypothetical protein
MFIAEHAGTKLLVDLAFIDKPTPSGGKFRSEQIMEVLSRGQFRISRLDEQQKLNRLTTVVSGITFWLRYGWFKPMGVASLRTAGHLLHRYKQILTRHPDINAALIEGTGFGTPMITSFLKSRDIRVYFVPANIEALVSYDNAWTHQIDTLSRLSEEIKYFRQCDGVFCISVTEHWLLSILSVRAFYLPYWPPRSIWQKVQTRRSTRRTDPSGNFFIYLADFRNEPNFKGFNELATKYGTQLSERRISIKILGKNTARIAALAKRYGVFEILDEVPDTQVEELLARCQGVILHHYPSSGFLTRVVDLWLSHIPIYCNLAASKDFVHLHGIHKIEAIFEDRKSAVDTNLVLALNTQYQALVSSQEDVFIRHILDGPSL